MTVPERIRADWTTPPPPARVSLADASAWSALCSCGWGTTGNTEPATAIRKASLHLRSTHPDGAVSVTIFEGVYVAPAEGVVAAATAGLELADAEADIELAEVAEAGTSIEDAALATVESRGLAVIEAEPALPGDDDRDQDIE